MKKTIGVLMVVLLFSCFLIKVDAKTSVSIDSAPKFNTDIKNNELELTIADTSGIKNSNIKIYKVDKNKKIKSGVVFKSKSTKQSSIGDIEYKCTVEKEYLTEGINYFYITITDNNGLKNDSYFKIVKKSNGKYSKYFAPKIQKLAINNTLTEINYIISDSGKIKNLTFKDLNNNKVIKTMSSSGTINSSLKLSNLSVLNNTQSLEIYTEDEDGNTATRIYKITITNMQDTSNQTNSIKNNNTTTNNNNNTTDNNNNTTSNNTTSNLKEVAPKETHNILIVGNSKTFRVPKKKTRVAIIFAHILKNEGIISSAKFKTTKIESGSYLNRNDEVTVVTKNAETLKELSKHTRFNKYMKDRTYDIVILQEKTATASGNYSTYLEGAKNIVKMQKNKKAKIYIRTQWIGQSSSASSQSKFNNNAKKVANKLKDQGYNVKVIHDGDALVSARGTFDVYDSKDHYHPSNEGAYIAAACSFKEIFGRNASTLKYVKSIYNDKYSISEKEFNSLNKIVDKKC